MKLLISTVLVLAPLLMASPTFAVDNSISTLCRADHVGSGYQRPGGFCDAVKAYGSQGLSSGGARCPFGTDWDTEINACIPEA